jgi:uncharacterized protein (DUF697 family)
MTEQALIPVDELEARVAGANEIIKRNMLWSAGAGVLPVPMVELIAITAVEIKLINELAEHYKLPFRHDLAKSAVLSLVGGLGSVTLGKMLAFSSLRAIPVFGQLVAVVAVPGMAAAITYAIGKVFTAHFEAGGTLLDFNPKAMREYFRAQYGDGLKQATARPATPAATVTKPATA